MTQQPGSAIVHSYITADNQAKIELSLELFEEFVDTAALEAQISSIQPRGMTPRMFIYNLVQQAKADKQHIVLPEGNDERILQGRRVPAQPRHRGPYSARQPRRGPAA